MKQMNHSKHSKHSNANRVLPEKLLSEIQQYVQGELLYIPKPKNSYKKWGDTTQSKAVTSARNDTIRLAFDTGSTIDELCKKHFLSPASIKKIVYAKT
jgi:Mor family transcriptional regulator